MAVTALDQTSADCKPPAGTQHLEMGRVQPVEDTSLCPTISVKFRRLLLPALAATALTAGDASTIISRANIAHNY